MPKIVAHRSGAGLRPENTLAACAHALALGVDGLEIDVRLSRDDEVVVFHDHTPDPGHVRAVDGERLAAPPLPVRDLTLSDLKRLDVGHPRTGDAGAAVAAVPGERIPTLGEFLDFLENPARRPLLLIELKTDGPTASPADPRDLTDATLDVLAKHALTGPVRLMSFDWRCLVHAMKILPPEQCVFLTAPGGTAGAPGDRPWFAGHAPDRYGGSAARAIRALEGRHWGPHFSQVSAESVAEASAHGLEISTWTVNTTPELKRVQRLGIEYLITDYPNRALAIRDRPEGFPKI